jgi:hypothetical protein
VYRPRHRLVLDRMRAVRIVLGAVVVLEVLAATARVGGVVNLHDGVPAVGVVEVNPAYATAGGWTKLTFVVRSGKGGLDSGRVVIVVPVGWSAPSTDTSDAGLVTSSAGNVAVTGRSIEVTGIHLLPSSTIVVGYGGGSGGATEPTQAGDYRFKVSVTDSHDTWIGPGPQSPVVAVITPEYGCQSANRPAGVGGQLRLPNGVVEANLYNTSQSAGSIQQCSKPSGVTNDLALADLKPIGYGPAGYPEVAYGRNLYDQPFCDSCPSYPFPLRVSQLGRDGHDLRLSVGYSLGRPSPPTLPRDFMYDIWLERAAQPGQPPATGDLELIIFLYQQGMAACPAGSPWVRFSTPIIVSGNATRSSWDVCQIRGGTNASPIAFFPESPAQSENGHLTFALRDFIDAASTYLGQSLSDHTVLGVEVGGEFNQCVAQQGCQIQRLKWSWSLQELTILDGQAAVPVVFIQRPTNYR